jgi:tetratricopeptide (TPR) repeat protein
LRQTLDRLLRRSNRADVIAANVGEGAQGVAVGKNIVQIGSIVIPFWSVLLLLGVILGGAATAAYALRGPTKMTGLFNVAIATFAEETDGAVGSSRDGTQLSQWVFDVLKNQQAQYETSAVGASNSVRIWHDSLGWREQGATIGYVDGTTLKEREANAAIIADRIGADVLLYGTLTPQNTIDLRFYVSPQLGTGGSSNTLAGHYQLGAQVPVNRANIRAQATALTVRNSALFWLVNGLSYAGQGYPAEALAVLEQAEAQLKTIWKERNEGKEILYHFQGESALFLAVDATDEAEFNQYIQRAEAALKRALASNPNYLRANIVAGSVEYVRSQCLLLASPCAETPTSYNDSLTHAQNAVAAYRETLALAEQSPAEPWAKGVAPMQLGAAYILLGRIYYAQGEDDPALEHLTQGIDVVGPSLGFLLESREHRLVIQAYIELGNAYRLIGNIKREQQSWAESRDAYTKARNIFDRCITQRSDAQQQETNDQFVSQNLIPLCREYNAAVVTELNALPAP